jgi:mono/diheme cytochrome c family protein
MSHATFTAELATARYCLAAVLFSYATFARSAEPLSVAARGELNLAARRILADHCFACHGPDQAKRQADLRLDTAEGLATIVVADQPAQSELIARVEAEDDDARMPPPDFHKPLSAAQIQTLQDWIRSGGEFAQHWSFVAPVKAADAPRDPVAAIDFFIDRKLNSAGLTANPPADRRSILRRVVLDVTGLPPSREQLQEFLSDDSPAAYERLVDRLLQSHHFGQHVGRYWLDLVRYGDTHGLHLDNYREMWPYRDWVVDAFNANMPHDEFITRQLAGDLLPDASEADRIASGFNRLNITTGEGGSIDEEVFVRNVTDRTDAFGTIFLGLSTGCAVCHDHKFDPLTMQDYYSLFAYFNSLDGKAMDGNAKDHPPAIPVPTEQQASQLAEIDQTIATLQQQMAEPIASVDQAQLAWQQAVLDPGPWQTYPAPRWRRIRLSVREVPTTVAVPAQIRKMVLSREARQEEPGANETDRAVREYYRSAVCRHPDWLVLVDQLSGARRIKEQLQSEVATTLVWRELASPRPAYILIRGQYDQPGPQVVRATPAFLPQPPPDAPRDRLGLALWLTSADHPLTARVAVNRVWQQIFGTGLVKTSEDFGSQGQPPSHGELLDWLAVDFQQHDWDVKRLFKSLLMSAAYRRSTQASPEMLRSDPANRLLARGPRHRLDAEVLRDQALAFAGLLIDQQGGPSVKPPQPSGLWEAVGYSGSNTVKFVADTGDKIYRRSLYTFWKRTAPPPQMATFDAPSRESCTARRERTNTPLQALALMNEQQYVEAAQHLAKRTLSQAGLGSDLQRLQWLFETVTCRLPTPAEQDELHTLLTDIVQHYQRQPEQAALLSGSKDPHAAAWTVVTSTLLNLDEVVSK